MPDTLNHEIAVNSDSHDEAGLLSRKRVEAIVLGTGAPESFLTTVRETMAGVLADRARVHYTEFTVFRHLDLTKGKPKPLPLAREILCFAHAIYPLFRQVAA